MSPTGEISRSNSGLGRWKGGGGSVQDQQRENCWNGRVLQMSSQLLLSGTSSRFAPLCSSSLLCCSGWIVMRNADSGLKSPKVCAFVSAATLTSSSEEILREIRLIFRNVSDTFQSDFLKAKPTLTEGKFCCFQRDY